MSNIQSNCWPFTETVKSPADVHKEGAILTEMLEIVEQKDALRNMLEEDRQRWAEFLNLIDSTDSNELDDSCESFNCDPILHRLMTIFYSPDLDGSTYHNGQLIDSKNVENVENVENVNDVFTTSYSPLEELLTEKEIRRQIELNQEEEFEQLFGAQLSNSSSFDSLDDLFQLHSKSLSDSAAIDENPMKIKENQVFDEPPLNCPNYQTTEKPENNYINLALNPNSMLVHQVNDVDQVDDGNQVDDVDQIDDVDDVDQDFAFEQDDVDDGEFSEILGDMSDISSIPDDFELKELHQLTELNEPNDFAQIDHLSVDPNELVIFNDVESWSNDCDEEKDSPPMSCDDFYNEKLKMQEKMRSHESNVFTECLHFDGKTVDLNELVSSDDIQFWRNSFDEENDFEPEQGPTADKTAMKSTKRIQQKIQVYDQLEKSTRTYQTTKKPQKDWGSLGVKFKNRGSVRNLVSVWEINHLQQSGRHNQNQNENENEPKINEIDDSEETETTIVKRKKSAKTKETTPVTSHNNSENQMNRQWSCWQILLVIWILIFSYFIFSVSFLWVILVFLGLMILWCSMWPQKYRHLMDS